jgi:pimeloyl-ACP methyl ester carboxylesterase
MTRAAIEGGRDACLAPATVETDFTEDLKKFDVPTLIIHGDDDQIVPIEASAKLSVKLVKNAQLKIYISC